jgi:hypothetical protein
MDPQQQWTSNNNSRQQLHPGVLDGNTISLEDLRKERHKLTVFLDTTACTSPSRTTIIRQRQAHGAYKTEMEQPPQQELQQQQIHRGFLDGLAHLKDPKRRASIDTSFTHQWTSTHGSLYTAFVSIE